LIASLEPLEHPWLLAAFILNIAGCLTLGLFGLYLFQKGPVAPIRPAQDSPAAPGAARAVPSS
jgi:hypothetical protein